MTIEDIIKEKEEKYYCYFDENQKAAIKEIVSQYMNYLNIILDDSKENIIIKIVGQYFSLPEDYNLLDTRKYAKQRQIAIYFIDKYTELSSTEICKRFNKDHALVLYSVKKVAGLIDIYRDFKLTISKI